ncbi:MAG: hypothetical protein NTX50_04080 [Candidatus Sumerlaeota bacterium]|nr:hypothetical protein [Candidatus Sumerlaeota bacterium]
MPKAINWEEKKQSWIAQVKELCATIEKWAKQKRWFVDEQEKVIEEPHLGEYTVPVLYIQTPQGRFFVEPMAREILGAEGRVDITVFPTYVRFLLVRSKNQWVINTDSRVEWPEPWSQEAFYNIVKAMAAAA